jgi:hypothetical protein
LKRRRGIGRKSNFLLEKTVQFDGSRAFPIVAAKDSLPGAGRVSIGQFCEQGKAGLAPCLSPDFLH